MINSFGINDKTYEMLVRDIIDSKEVIDCEYLAYFTIDRFTIIKPEDLDRERKKYEYSFYDINKIKYNKKIEQYEYKNDGMIITFSKLSDMLKTTYYNDELHSEERYHKCHEKAIELSPYLLNSKVWTGYLCLGDCKILHSVIEFGSFIIDFNINAVMKKEDYLKLTKFEIKKVLESEKIIEDKESRIFDILWDKEIPLKIYLLFRDELIEDLKNKKGKLF